MDGLTRLDQALRELGCIVPGKSRRGRADPVHRFREVDGGRPGRLEVVQNRVEPVEEGRGGREWAQGVGGGACDGDGGLRWGSEPTGEEEGDDECREGGDSGCSSDLTNDRVVS